MSSSTGPMLLSALSSLITLLFLVSALIWASTKSGDGSRAKSYAIVGITMLLLLQVFSFLLRIVLARLASENIAISLAAYSVLSSLLHSVAIGMLLAAAFTGRQSSVPAAEPENEFYPKSSDNPYSPPAN
ncbi:MAG: hypothetical protein AB8B91_14865 [Rubripirellula sp.]